MDIRIPTIQYDTMCNVKLMIDNNNVMSVTDNNEYSHMKINVKTQYTDETMPVIGNSLVTAIEISSMFYLNFFAVASYCCMKIYRSFEFSIL